MIGKLVVLGIDGADWGILQALMDEGHLGNFRRVMENGSYGKLRSTIPSVTPPAWTSMFTGVNPGKHGLGGFLREEKGNPIPLITTSRQNLAPYVWELMESKTILVFNVPFTYPPRGGANALIVSGLGTPSVNSEFTLPKELKGELLAVSPNYALGAPAEAAPLVFSDNKAKTKSEMQERMGIAVLADMKARQKAMLHFLEKKEWDAAILAFSETDWLQHEMLSEFCKSGKKAATPIGQAYLLLDGFLGYLIEKQHNVIITSDHGFQELKQKLFLNTHLARKGLLVLRKRGLPRRITTEFLAFCRKCILMAVPMVPAPALRSIRRFQSIVGISKAIRRGQRCLGAQDIDYDNTTAVFLGRERLTIHAGITLTKSSGFEELEQALMDCRDEEGRKLIKAVVKKEDIYSGSEATRVPDVFAIPESGVGITAKFGPNAVERLVHGGSGHAYNGIFLAYGPDLKRKGELKDLSVMDIAPTMLSFFGYALPKYMDGRCIPVVETVKGGKNTLAAETRARLRALRSRNELFGKK